MKGFLSIFGIKEPKKPDPIVKPPEAPVPDDKKAKNKLARDQQRKYATRGRAGTILSDTGNLG